MLTLSRHEFLVNRVSRCQVFVHFQPPYIESHCSKNHTSTWATIFALLDAVLTCFLFKPLWLNTCALRYCALR